MEGIKLRLLCWEDGQKVEKQMQLTDRWELHSAVELQVEFPWAEDVGPLRLQQEPHALGAARMGVGACLWEGELLLAAYLASLPAHRFMGARVVELGSGPGLVGLMLARMGAKVVITDIEKVLPLTRRNVELNGLSPEQRRGAACGFAEVAELEWGKEGYESVVASLAGDQPVDWVLAADCCYIDNEGQSPSTQHFIRACHGLCSTSGGGGAEGKAGGSAGKAGSSGTRCLVSFELRSSHVKETFLSEAARAFARVARVPPHALPRGCQVEHIELYELSGRRERILPLEGRAE